MTTLLRQPSPWLVVVAIFLVFALEYGYFAGVEIAMGGRSFGKWALGLQVVTRGGGRPGVTALLLRNCVRSVDLLVGVPLMATDPLARRLGDRLGGTLVVQRPDRDRELVAIRLPAGWRGQDVAVVEAFLLRAPELEPGRAEAMASSLLERIRRDDASLLAGLPDDLSPLEALRRAVQGA